MVVIGIAGGTGSGKTTVVSRILENFKENEIALIPQDSYYKDISHLPLDERLQQNFDCPEAIDFDLLCEQLEEIMRGNAIEQPQYTYTTCLRSDQTVRVESSPIIIIEGILIFTNERLRDLMNIKIFVDADADERLLRNISRDVVERGRNVADVMERYRKILKPMHNMYIEPTRQYADLILPRGGHNEIAIDIVMGMIEKMLINEGVR